MSRGEESEDSWKMLKYSDVKNAVENGDECAKTKLAWLMLSGLGGSVSIDRNGDSGGRSVGNDADSAVELLEERVKDRDSEAMWILGVCHEYGLGTEQDVERAESLYTQSSDEGNEIGKFFVSHRRDERRSGIMSMNSL